eukprot:TRINITY_DN8403_c1_g4_i2.p1 TRINITY_DN8403_c1_g4~~TRINITY_DN8403_c1_g4_i2.p1  ORF type:complete len:122 (-),score=11.45 TRINITY_DN8403_c1_g4_i2:49-414(-)
MRSRLLSFQRLLKCLRTCALRQLCFGTSTQALTLGPASEVLESKGFKISRTKIEYVDCNFNGQIQSTKTIVGNESWEIQQRDSFHYLSLIISKDGENDENAKHRIRARWLKQRLASRVLCN